ncbi:hypothetical protein LEP1GSC073_1255 [Leptospira noguchii str. Cascata]|nr:hypothetical protein LEP1GSC072_2443 [Leptospira noguchii str. Bonito]EMS86474.1 hypothetical protein LEP1GSC073_1255 [Leptospira noguchii str. Cascata]
MYQVFSEVLEKNSINPILYKILTISVLFLDNHILKLLLSCKFLVYKRDKDKIRHKKLRYFTVTQ